MVSLKDLTWQQEEAIVLYRDYRRTMNSTSKWKDCLLHDWLKSSYSWGDRDRYCYLQQIRNTKGPQWLTKITEKELNISIFDPSYHEIISELFGEEKAEEMKRKRMEADD